MSDEQENVDTGSESTDETTEASDTAETAEGSSEQTEGEDESNPKFGTEAPDASQDDENAETVVDANKSRTGLVESGRPGEQCTCPDGRTGTIHRFDEGLICIPNADQG